MNPEEPANPRTQDEALMRMTIALEKNALYTKRIYEHLESTGKLVRCPRCDLLMNPVTVERATAKPGDMVATVLRFKVCERCGWRLHGAEQ